MLIVRGNPAATPQHPQPLPAPPCRSAPRLESPYGELESSCRWCLAAPDAAALRGLPAWPSPPTRSAERQQANPSGPQSERGERPAREAQAPERGLLRPAQERARAGILAALRAALAAVAVAARGPAGLGGEERG